jgi:hypothetical protein
LLGRGGFCGVPFSLREDGRKFRTLLDTHGKIARAAARIMGWAVVAGPAVGSE